VTPGAAPHRGQRCEELDPGVLQTPPKLRRVVHDEPDDPCAPEEIVIRVGRPVHVKLGAVTEAVTGGSVVGLERHELERVLEPRHHLVEALGRHPQPSESVQTQWRIVPQALNSRLSPIG
jgi:hypothetical protein